MKAVQWVCTITTCDIDCCRTDTFKVGNLVQFVGDRADDRLVSEVQMEALKVHLPVDPLVSMCLGHGQTDVRDEQKTS